MSEGLGVVVDDLPAGLSSHHAEDTSLMLVRSGAGRVTVDSPGAPDREASIHDRVLLLVPEGAGYGLDIAQPVRIATVRFPADVLDNELSWVRGLPGSGGYFRRQPSSPRLPIRSWELPSATAERAWSAALAVEETEGQAIFSRIGALMRLFEVLDPFLSQPDRLPMHDVTARVIALLERDLSASWTLAELARRVHLSRSQVNRTFSADTGQTPLAYLHRLRAERMARLLRTTDVPIRDAGALVGWADPGNATKRFTSHWKMLPTRYRAQTATERAGA